MNNQLIILLNLLWLCSSCAWSQPITGIYIHEDADGNIVFVGTDENDRAGKVPAVTWNGADILVNGEPIGGTQIWQEVGDGRIYYNTDNVGIGTDDPDFQLTTTQDIKIHNIRIGQGAQAAGLGLGVFGNTFVGEATGETITTGFLNTAVGWQTGDAITTGNTNTLFGSSAGQELNTGSSNTFIGQSAGGFVTSGRGNTVIGYASSPSADSDNNVIIGDSNVGIEGNENIIIGNNIALFGMPKNEYLQIADILYGKDIESPSNDVSGGSIGINVTDPLFNFHTVGTVGFENLTETTATKILYFNPTSYEVSFSDAPAQPDLSVYDNHIANDQDLDSTNEQQAFTHDANNNRSSLSLNGGFLQFNDGTNIDVVADGNGSYSFNFTGDAGGSVWSQSADQRDVYISNAFLYNVGINTVTPEYNFHVEDGDGYIENGLTLGTNAPLTLEGSISLNGSFGQVGQYLRSSGNGNGAKVVWDDLPDGSSDNELDQFVISIAGKRLGIDENTSASGSYVDFQEGGGIGITFGQYSSLHRGFIRLTNTAPANPTDELQSFGFNENTNITTLSGGGGSFQIDDGTGIGVSLTNTGSYTVTNTAPSKWTQSDDDIFYNAGNLGKVGIGTTAPANRLHVKGGSFRMEGQGNSVETSAYITSTPSSSVFGRGLASARSIEFFDPVNGNSSFVRIRAGGFETLTWQDEALYMSGHAGDPNSPDVGSGAYYFNSETNEYRFYDHASDSWNPVALNPVEEGRIRKGFWTSDVETGNIFNNNGGRVEINNGLFVGRGGLTLDNIEELDTPFTLQYDSISKQVSYYHAWSVDKSGSSALTLAPATNVLKLTESILEGNLDLDDLKTLTGVAGGSADLGVFLGTTIPDNTTIKNALQRIVFALELLADKSVVIEGGPFKGDLEAFQNGIRNNQWYELSDDNDYGAPKNTPRRLKLF